MVYWVVAETPREILTAGSHYQELSSEPQDIDSETYANSMGMTIINSLSRSDFHDLIAKLTTVLQDPHRRERGKVCIVCTCLKIT